MHVNEADSLLFTLLDVEGILDLLSPIVQEMVFMINIQLILYHCLFICFQLKLYCDL